MIENTSEAQAPQVLHTNAKTNQKYMVYGFGIFLAILVVLSPLIGVYRAYSKTALDPFTVLTAKIFRFPAVKIDNNRISYADFAEHYKTIQNIKKYDIAHNGPGKDLPVDDMTDQVIFRLVNNSVVEDLAKEYNLTVTDAEIESFKQQELLQQFSSLADAEKVMQERYGWSLKTYENNFIRPFILQNKVAEKMQRKDEIKKNAQAVLDQIKGGAKFEDSAKQYGQDNTAEKGGDLGWFAATAMVPEFSAPTFALKKGQLSPELIESRYGYHIVQVLNKRIDRAKDGTKTDMVNARHILFLFPSINEYLTNKITKANVKLYLKVHDPFVELKKIQ